MAALSLKAQHFQTETCHNPTGDSKQQHFPLMETRRGQVMAGSKEPEEPRSETTITEGSLCSFLKFDEFTLLSLNSKAENIIIVTLIVKISSIKRSILIFFFYFNLNSIAGSI